MGYTHYFPQLKTVSNENWKKITNDITKAIDILKKTGVYLQSNHFSSKMVTTSYINFNGVDDGEYETFRISKKKESSFNFCKTERKPYDLAVMVTLLIIEYHQPNSFEISSDGSPHNWKKAMIFNAENFGYAYKLPPNISKDYIEYTNAVIKEIENNIVTD